MADTNLSEALASSLADEGTSVRERIARVDLLLHPQALPAPPPPPSDKVVRDGFSMPASDYALIGEMQAALLELRVSVTKSEVVRAGLHALKQLNGDELVALFGSLEKVKTGRPNTK
jgi:hypothetical protein